MSVQIITKRNDLLAYAHRMEQGVGEALLELGGRMRDTASELVAVDTGELQESLAVERQDEHTVVVSAGTDHAEPNEFGTVHMPAHPFMLPGFDRHVGEIDQLVAERARAAE